MKILKSKFFKNVLSLLTGSGISQLIAMGSIPLLANVYTPEEFGIYATFIAFVSILAIFSTGRYELAIMLPKKDKDSLQVFYLTQLLNIMMFLISFFLLSGVLLLLNAFFNDFLTISIVLYFCLAVFSLSMNTSLIYLANKYKNFYSISISRVLNSFFIAFFSILLYKFNVYGMMIGFVLGNLFSAINLYTKMAGKFEPPNLKIIKEMLLEYSELPKKNTISSLFNICSTQLPIILMTSLFGSVVSGHYSMALRFLNAPITFIGKAFSQVHFNKISTMMNKDKYKFYCKTTFGLFLFITPILLLFLVYSDLIITTFLGEEWTRTALIIQILIPFYIVRFVFSSQSSILITERAFNFDLKFNVTNAIYQIGAVYIIYLAKLKLDYVFIIMSFAGVFLYSYLGIKMGIILKGKINENNTEKIINSSSLS